MTSTRAKSLLAALSAVALLAPPAFAQTNTKVGDLPAASAVNSTDVFPGSQGCTASPPSAGCTATNGVTAAQIKTFTSAAPTFNTFAGLHAVTSITAGSTSVIGTGGTVVCAASHVCDSLSGELTIATGTGTLAAGTIATVTFADTRTNLPSCVVNKPSTSTGSVNATWSETTSTLVVGGQSALTASTTYTSDYVCAGN
jgi:hypothetical protein